MISLIGEVKLTFLNALSFGVVKPMIEMGVGIYDIVDDISPLLGASFSYFDQMRIKLLHNGLPQLPHQKIIPLSQLLND